MAKWQLSLAVGIYNIGIQQAATVAGCNYELSREQRALEHTPAGKKVN